MAAALTGTPQSGNSSTANRTTIATTAPAGSVGDLLLLVVEVAANTPTVTTPTGWTQLHQLTAESNAANCMWVGYRVADGGANDTPTVTHTSGRDAWGMVRVTGSQAATGLVSGQDDGPAVAVTTVDAPTVSPSTAGLHLVFYGSRTNASVFPTWTPPSGYTEATDNVSASTTVSNASAAIAWKAVSSGATGAQTGTASVTVNAVGVSVAVIDASSGTIANAGVAQITAAASGPSEAVAPTSGVAAATLAAPAPKAGVTPTAGVAAATLAAHAPTTAVATGGAGVAAATLAAHSPSVAIVASAGVATITGAAHDATASGVPAVIALAGVATIGVAALGPAASIAASAGVAVLTAAAHAPTAVILVVGAGSAPRGLTGAVEYVVELFDSGGTFGPDTKLGEIWDARNVGWSRYDRLPGKGFLTLYQDSPHLSKFSPLITHARVTRVAPAGDTEVYNGQFVDYDSTGDDVVLEFFDYITLLAVSRTGYRTLYPKKLLGTEIAQIEVAAAIAATFSPLGFVAMGTVEDPVGTDGVTPIRTNDAFGLLDQMRLQLLWDLTEMGRANTIHHVTYEITRTAPFTFNLWKNKGSALNIGLTLNGNVSDYRFLPNWRQYRNDIASLGSTTGGGATEIIKTNEAAAAVRGRRQDVATIKTVLGIVGSTVEADQQQAAAARMLQVATQKTTAIVVNLERGTMAPFDGWDIADTVIPEIGNGIDTITARHRIAGVRGLYTEAGEDLGLIIEPVLVG